MAFPSIDLTGQPFGRLTVTRRAPRPERKLHPMYLQRVWWFADCSCGKKDHIVCSGPLRAGRTKSCGCAHAEAARVARLKIKAKAT